MNAPGAVADPGSHRRAALLAAGIAALLATGCGRAPSNQPERVRPNDNRVQAGVLADGILTLHLEARQGSWFPDEDGGPSLLVETFAEVGRPAQNPGPLIRVVAGTTIRVTIHSVLDSVLVVYGLHPRPGSIDDTIQVAPGETREITFPAGEPGTYFYWGTTTHRAVADRNGIDSQLHGAFIVDPPGAPPPTDRVFVLGSWTGTPDRAGITADLRVINGLSWPRTERFTYAVGDTVRWRWVNPTDSPHPMHLHGFFFEIESRGSWAADSSLHQGGLPTVVTEMPISGGTFAMRWIPEEPGNWLFHCHVAYHTSIFLSAVAVPDLADPIGIDPMAGMRGMVLALTVRPGASPARRPGPVPGARAIRLIAQSAPKRADGGLAHMAFVRQEGDLPPSPDSIPTPSSLLVLRRGEPVRVTIVNHLRTATSVHWHGIEVPSFSDGVADWSGGDSHRAHAIAPGDSFVAAFTPPRSGTFIYHAHANETFQISLGLYGALLVVDPARYQPEEERLIVLGSAGPSERGARINGREEPDTLRLAAGVRYRLRLIHIIPDWTATIALMRGDSVVQWRAVAKDGAELPAAAQRTGPATLLAGPGETMDFEYQPTEPGLLRLEVRQRTGIWATRLPIRVE